MYIVFLSIFFIIILTYLYIFNHIETFVDLKLYAIRLLGSPKHVRLNKFNKVESIHLSPHFQKLKNPDAILYYALYIYPILLLVIDVFNFLAILYK